MIRMGGRHGLTLRLLLLVHKKIAQSKAVKMRLCEAPRLGVQDSECLERLVQGLLMTEHGLAEPGSHQFICADITDMGGSREAPWRHLLGHVVG